MFIIYQAPAHPITTVSVSHDAMIAAVFEDIPAVTRGVPAVTRTVPAVMDGDTIITPESEEIVTPATVEIVTPATQRVVTPAETDAEFEARMVSALVPPGAQHVIVDPVTLPGVPVERWIVDWGMGVVTTRAATVTVADIVAERERRMALGFDYVFGGARGVHHIGTTPADMKGWDEVTQATQAMIALGAGATTLTVVTDTGPATITALEWQYILMAASASRQPLWAHSFALQAMTPIPADYADDTYWS